MSSGYGGRGDICPHQFLKDLGNPALHDALISQLLEVFHQKFVHPKHTWNMFGKNADSGVLRNGLVSHHGLVKDLNTKRESAIDTNERIAEDGKIVRQ